MKTHTLYDKKLQQDTAITQCKSLIYIHLISILFNLLILWIQQQTNGLVKTCSFAFFSGLALLPAYEEKPFQTKKF